MRITYSAILIASFYLGSCKSKHSTSTESKAPDAAASSYTPYSKTESSDTYTANSDYDGTYCGKIKYFNPSTGTTSYYELTVDITEGYLTKIHFPNGGWLDNTHFTAPAVSSSGYASFTSDKGYQYEVIVQSEGECANTSYNLPPPPPSSYNRSGYDNSDELSEDEREEQQVDGKLGAVVKTFSGCDYFIISMNGDYVVAEWMGQYTPDEGDRIRGKLNSFGTKEFWVVNRSRTTKLWIDDYALDWEAAIEKIREKCNLDDE